MDGDGGLDMRNWGYYESPLLKSHVGLQMMPNVGDRKPILCGRDATLMGNVNGGFNQRDCGVSSSQFQMNYMRDAWVHREAKYFDMLPNGPNYPHMPETSSAAAQFLSVQLLQQPESCTDDRLVNVNEVVSENSNSPPRKRSVGKDANASKTKKSKKAPSVYREKKVTEVVINGMNMDICSIPIPVCSCTSTPQQCYKWGSGGWQSACCTTGMSQYPLPMSTKRRGARIAGRKMSLGAFKKVLEKLAAEGYNFANPIDLRTYWAKHGTNKFVTIR